MLRNELLKEEIAWQEILDKAKNQEPMEYDYSDSKRLLPQEYYGDYRDCKAANNLDPEAIKRGMRVRFYFCISSHFIFLFLARQWRFGNNVYANDSRVRE